MKAKISTIVRVTVTVGVIALILWFSRGKLGEAFEILHHEFELPYFILAAAIYFFSMGLLAWRMHFALDVKHVKWDFINTFYISFVGVFFSLFLPSAIGGDVIKGVYLAKHARRKADVFSCLIVDRLSGLFVVSFITFASAAALHESWNHIPAWVSWAGLIGLISAGTAIFLRPEWIPFVFSKMRFLPHRFQEKLNEFYDSLSGFFHDRPFLIRSLLCSIAAQVLFITAYFFVGKSLDVDIPFGHFFLLIPMITMTSMLPSIGGAGPREAGALFLFKMYMPDERAWALTILMDVLIFSFGLFGGIWYLLRGHQEKLPE